MARTSGEYLILPIINQQLEYKHQAMTSNTVETLNERLLYAIDSGDLETYRELCDPSLTAFEPEALGNLVEGLGFHETYFGSPASGKRKSSVRAPHIRLLGDTAVVAYVRLVQSTTSDGQHSTTDFEETRGLSRLRSELHHDCIIGKLR